MKGVFVFVVSLLALASARPQGPPLEAETDQYNNNVNVPQKTVITHSVPALSFSKTVVAGSVPAVSIPVKPVVRFSAPASASTTVVQIPRAEVVDTVNRSATAIVGIISNIANTAGSLVAQTIRDIGAMVQSFPATKTVSYTPVVQQHTIVKEIS